MEVETNLEVETKKRGLADILADGNELARVIMENHGVLTPEIESALDTLEFEKAEKVDDYDYRIEQFKYNAEMIKQRAANLIAIARSMENVCERIRERIKAFLLTQEEKTLRGNECYFKLIEGKETSQLLIDDEKLSPEYFDEKIIFVPNEERIWDAILDGKEVEGVSVATKQTIQVRRYNYAPLLEKPKAVKKTKAKKGNEE